MKMITEKEKERSQEKDCMYSQIQVLNTLNSIVEGINFTVEDFSDLGDGKLKMCED